MRRLIGIGVIVVIVGVVAVTYSRQNQQAPPTSPPDALGATTTTEADLPPLFSVFAREQEQSERSLEPTGFVDRDSLRQTALVDGFRYGVGTQGSLICMIKRDGSTGINWSSCVQPENIAANGIFAIASTSPDVREHAHIAVLVVDGYTHVRVGDDLYEIVDNMVVFNRDPFPTAGTLEGPAGNHEVTLPEVPEPGALYEIGHGSP